MIFTIIMANFAQSTETFLFSLFLMKSGKDQEEQEEENQEEDE